MCDVNPDKLDAEEKLMKPKEKTLVGSICMKCKTEKAVVVIRVQDPMCRACFLTYVTHKFRSTLGKSKLVQPNDKVLLALSGGHASTALLHLVKDALSLGAHKRLRFSPGVVCIDESQTLPPAEGQDYSHVEKSVALFGYPFYLSPIYNGFANGNGGIVENGNDEGPKLEEEKSKESSLTLDEDRLKFKECFDSTTSLTAKQDFLRTQRVWLITQIAKTHGYTKIMFGDTSTSLCVKLISNIALGRGNTVPLDLGVADRRYPGVTMIRPLREIASKEVAMFNRLSNILVELPYNMTTMKDSGSSLQQKTEEFINGLQTDFPHTVNTVFRTGDKVCSTHNTGKECDTCAMCYSPINQSNTVTVDSNGICNGNGNGGGCCGAGDGGCESYKLTSTDMRRQFCYACGLTFKDMKHDVDVLPRHIVDNATAQMKRDKMKDSIKDFLLE